MKAKFFDFYSTYIWPIIRPIVTLSPRCKICILNNYASKLTDNICEECHQFVSTGSSDHIEATSEQSEQFIQRIQSLTSSNTYDCIFLLSGGKDSAYTLHRLRTEFPRLKILAVTVNNGFMSPYAVGNAEKAALKLNVNWLLHNSDVEQFKRVLRDAFLKLNGQGCSGIVDHADGTLIFETAKKIALEMSIPTVISGLSWVQVQRIVGQNHFELKNQSGLSEIFPMAIWRTNEQEIRSHVRKNGLMLAGSDSPLVSNSTLITAMAVLDMKNLGYSSFEPEFAQLIREGKSDRKSWLRIFQLLEFAAKRGFLDQDLDNTLKSLDIKLNEVLSPSAGKLRPL